MGARQTAKEDNSLFDMLNEIDENQENHKKEQINLEFDEEFANAPISTTNQLSMKRSMTLVPPKKSSKISQQRDLFSDALIDHLELIKEEIETCKDAIVALADEHINDGDMILTYSYSKTLIAFLQNAKEEQNVRFEVIVCETAPTFEGQKLAMELAKLGIQTNLVQDAAAFGLLSRVDKVIVSAHGIMATGGIIGQTGILNIAHAAKAQQVPFFVLGASYKLTPLHPIDSHTYNELLSPETIFELQDDDVEENIEVILPAFDYVPPKLVSLILTNQEGYTPQNIYRAFNNLYGK